MDASYFSMSNNEVVIDFLNRIDQENYTFIVIVQIILMNEIKTYFIINFD